MIKLHSIIVVLFLQVLQADNPKNITVETLQKEMNTSFEYDGKFHKLIKSITVKDLENEALITFLFNNVGWKIDSSSLPQGKKYPWWYVYPVAVRLKDNIKHQKVMDGMWKSFGQLSTLENRNERFYLTSWIASKDSNISSYIETLSKSVAEGELLVHKIKTLNQDK